MRLSPGLHKHVQLSHTNMDTHMHPLPAHIHTQKSGKAYEIYLHRIPLHFQASLAARVEFYQML